jgi:hypothetical protein
MQWASKHFNFAAEAPKVPLSTAPSSPSFMKFARLTAPFSADATTFMISKMKEDGFTGVSFSVSQEDWRLHRNIIVSVFYVLSAPLAFCRTRTRPALSCVLRANRAQFFIYSFFVPNRSAASSPRTPVLACKNFLHWHSLAHQAFFTLSVSRLASKITQFLFHARFSRAALLDLSHAVAAGKQLSSARLLSKSAGEASSMRHTPLSSQTAQFSDKHSI